MPKIEQNQKELKKHLTRQMKFIQKSSEDFDRADTQEAIRISTSVRMLLHDTKNYTSLLKLINDKENLLFLNSATKFDPKNLISHMGLCIRVINDNKRF